MPAQANVSAYVRGFFTKAGTLAGPQVEYVINLAAVMETGTGDTQLDKAWGKTAAISALEDLDLIGSTIKDEFGDNLAFAEVCGLIVAAPAANTGNITVGAAAALPAVIGVGAGTHTRVIKPGGFFVHFDPTGWALATGSTDVLRVAPSTGTQTYSIIVLGRSA